MQGFVWVIFFKQKQKLCYLALLTMDGWFHFFRCKGLEKSQVTSTLLTVARISFVSMYVWLWSFANGSLQQLFTLLKSRAKIIC